MITYTHHVPPALNIMLHLHTHQILSPRTPHPTCSTPSNQRTGPIGPRTGPPPLPTLDGNVHRPFRPCRFYLYLHPRRAGGSGRGVVMRVRVCMVRR